MNVEKIKRFVIRHRVGFQDLSIVAAVFAVSAYFAFEVDIFANAPGVPTKEHTIEIDEALLLGGILMASLLIFSIRRFLEQRRETQRRIEAEQHVRELAFQDGLTGLANRRQFDDALREAVASPPSTGATHAVLLLDLNGFKKVNDVFGHGTGDEALTIVAHRLLSAARKGDLVARFGGDEFAILARHLAGPEAASTIALRVIQALETDISIGSNLHRIGTGIGIALVPRDAETAQEAIRKADVALYRAKSERKSAMRFFEEEMDHIVRERERMERELRNAIDSRAIHAVFQPFQSLTTQKIVGFEAHPRWIHPDLGEIPAERFLPIAEESGLLHKLADQLLRESCSAAVLWPDDIGLSIDFQPGQLTDPTSGVRILDILEQTGLSPSRLSVEISESALVRELAAAQTIFGSLREKGVKIVLDNFGTGYSTLYHLRCFKLDKVKIDRRFIATDAEDPENASVVRALIGLGRGLGLVIAAEGIEDADQRAALLGNGCQEGQGTGSEALSASATIDLFQGSQAA